MSDVEGSDTQDSLEESDEAGEEYDRGLDQEDLRSIEDELFDLEDELIEMQGTTIRTFDESEEQQELQQVYTFEKSDDRQSGEAESGEEEDLLSRMEKLKDSMQNTQEVRPGQLLAADLRGSTPEFEGGLYTITTPKADRIYAGRQGQVTWSDNKVHVLPLRKIDNDLDVDERDVRYDGSVLIEGNIHDNKVVEATGNIWVLGSVGRSDLKAGGDLVVAQGIKGSEDHTIDVHGNVYAEFIENAVVLAGGNVFTEEVIMHSRIEADESIFLLGEKGYLVGGEARASHQVFAQEIGSKNYPETSLHMGSSGTLQRELEQAKKEKNELAEEESEYAKDVENLLEKKEQGGGLSPKDEERLRNFQFELNHVRQDLQETEAKIKDLEEELESSREREVIVEGTIFPGVQLQMGNQVKEIDSEKSHTVIRNEEAEVVFDGYKEPDKDLDLTTEIDPESSELEEKFDTPPLDQVRKHLVYNEEDPLFDRERQFKRLLDLPAENELVLIDITDDDEDGETSEDSKGEPQKENGEVTRRKWWAIEVRESEKKRDVELHFGAKRRDSVKVKCETPDEGIERAAEYFDVDPSDLAVKIIEEGSSGVMGFGQEDYLIRAVLKSSLKQQQEESTVEENDLLAEAQQQEEVAGFINLENSEDGLWLAVYPPEGHGLPVTVEQVEDELEENGYTNDIDWEKVEKLVEEAAGEKEKIGPRQRDPEIDGSFSVNLNDMETQAYLTVYPPKPEGIPIEKSEVINHLDDEGMDYDKSKIDNVFEEERYEEDVLIAEGSRPKHGDDGSVEFNVDIPQEQIAELLDDEDVEEEEAVENEPDENEVDHREGERIISTKENEILAEIKPATEGEPGITVYGEEIPCEAGENIEIEAGDYVRQSGDRTQLIAEADGRVIVKNGKLAVEPVFIVEGNLDYDTGNIDFDGVVVVKGQILDGFKVEASERVEAESAGKCKIISGGDVYLERGMAGKEKGLIEAQGDVYAKYLENTQVRAEGNVVVEETIMHSNVDAGKNLIIKGSEKGAVIGGKIRAGKVIDIKKLGSGMASKTEVEVGIPPSIRDRVVELENEIESQKAKFEKVRLGLQGLNEKIDELGSKSELPEEKQEKHTRLSNVAEAIKHKLKSLHRELEDLRNEVQSSQGGEVCVEEGVYAGTKITIQTATLHVTDDDDHIRCLLENGEVVRRAYEDPEIEIDQPEPILE